MVVTDSASGSPTLRLPQAGGALTTYVMHNPVAYPRHPRPFTARTVFAAPHVVADITGDYTPGERPPVDWDSTLAFRRHLWSYGIGVAEAMDTSERGPGGLVWEQAQTLIRLSTEAARDCGGAIVCGAGTDQIDSATPQLAEVVDAYLEQLSFIEDCGGRAVLRASHALVAAATTPEDYLHVYGTVLEAAAEPAIVHWLGTVFDPTLRGYWGSENPRVAMETVMELVGRHGAKLRGIKFSLLDDELECELRTRVPEHIEIFTGDDYSYTDLLRGEGGRHSHGLLGVLDPIAPIASTAFAALEDGNEEAFEVTLRTTEPLAARLFERPAHLYKVGTVFLAWLTGHQDHNRMVTGREGMRSLLHLTDIFAGADALGLFPDPELTCSRMRAYLAVNGVQ